MDQNSLNNINQVTVGMDQRAASYAENAKRAAIAKAGLDTTQAIGVEAANRENADLALEGQLVIIENKVNTALAGKGAVSEMKFMPTDAVEANQTLVGDVLCYDFAKIANSKGRTAALRKDGTFSVKNITSTLTDAKLKFTANGNVYELGRNDSLEVSYNAQGAIISVEISDDIVSEFAVSTQEALNTAVINLTNQVAADFADFASVLSSAYAALPPIVMLPS